MLKSSSMLPKRKKIRMGFMKLFGMEFFVRAG